MRATSRMPRSARATLLVALLLLGAVFVTPLWSVRLVAPQYPEGIGMLIRLNTVEGMKEHDLRNINSLNHYIGMKAIEPDAIPELRYMPWIAAGLIAAGLLVAASGRRRLLVAWTAGFALLAAAGLYDFWRWSYDYGHNLDMEKAIIVVPGMTYQPPLIGTKQLLNFTATSLPATGGLLAGVSLALAIGAIAVSYRRGRAGVAALSLAAAACASDPSIAFGRAACEECRMIISDRRFGALLVTEHGRTITFDSIDCLRTFAARAGAPTARETWLVTPARQGRWWRRRRRRWWNRTARSSRRWAEPYPGEPAMLVRVLVGSLLLANAGHAQRVIDVRPGGSLTIAQAVRGARTGDHIVIARGTYREPTIVVERSLTILGEPGATLDGGAATHILRVEADDVTVRGLTFRNVAPSHVEDRAAIRVGAVRRCVIEDNRVENAFFGFYLAGSSGCRIARNVLHGNGTTEDRSGNGIHLWTVRDIDVLENRISGHRDGVYLEFTHDARVARNTSERNVRYGLHFMYSDDCWYANNEFRGNQAGVAVMYTKRVTMTGNLFADNWGPAAYGLLLKEISDSRLEGNRFTRNTTGLLADGAMRMIARDNVFTGNGWAVKLMASTQDASLTGNTFVGNTFDVATNSRTSGATLSGNYWDQYEGYDLNRDGRGDVPHRPVRLFALVVEQNEPLLVLLRSAVVSLLDRTERVLPSLTPEALADTAPLMRRPK